MNAMLVCHAALVVDMSWPLVTIVEPKRVTQCVPSSTVASLARDLDHVLYSAALRQFCPVALDQLSHCRLSALAAWHIQSAWRVF
eukprot:287594-Amphidinium_carterae.1